MLSKNETLENIADADAAATEQKKELAGEALDLIALRSALAEQLAVKDRELASVLTRLQKLMDLDEFARHARLTKAEMAMWADPTPGQRAKPRSRTAAADIAGSSPASRTVPADRGSRSTVGAGQ